jgi:predicted O-linked N-acetylglucosamine transferase (SPINDLY family)
VLTAGKFTFGSFNQPNKIRPQAWRAWARILAAVPDARLLVLAHGGGPFEQTARVILGDAGLDLARVLIVGQRSRIEFLRLHHEVDLALDTFPFNGHTTICDGLWMGVPSIMLEGSSYVSRFGTSALRNVGLDELVTDSVDAYVRTAISFASHRDRLAELRATMRDRLQASPLLDAVGFTRNLEDAYRAMATRHQGQVE